MPHHDGLSSLPLVSVKNATERCRSAVKALTNCCQNAVRVLHIAVFLTASCSHSAVSLRGTQVSNQNPPEHRNPCHSERICFGIRPQQDVPGPSHKKINTPSSSPSDAGSLSLRFNEQAPPREVRRNRLS